MNGYLALLIIVLVPVALVVVAWALGPVLDRLWKRPD